MAIAMVVIALNMTYSNMRSADPKPAPVTSEEKVLPVVGRVSVAFDGMGADIGFLVQDGPNLQVVRYDEGSMAANRAYQPKLLQVTKFSDGRVMMDSLQLEKFSN